MPVSAHGKNNHPDNIRVEYDDKERALDLSAMNLTPPAVGIFDEPTRCYKLNHEWSKIIIGMVSWLAATPVWKEAENEGYSAIEEILKFMMQAEVCMDCGGVEECLETSTIITIIEGDIVSNETNIAINETNITTNETSITTNETNITNIEQGGVCCNVFEDLPTSSEPDELCGASWNISNEINDYIQQAIIDAGSSTLNAWLTAIFAIGGFFGALALTLWDYIDGHSNPNLDTEVSDAIDEIAEYIYCNEIDMSSVKDEITASATITADAKEAWNTAIDTITASKIAIWAFLGAQDTTADCSSFVCGPWCYTWLDGDITGLAGVQGFGGCWPVVTTTEITGCCGTAVTGQYAKGKITVVQPGNITEVRIEVDSHKTRASSQAVTIKIDGVIKLSEATDGPQTHTLSGSFTVNTSIEVYCFASSWLVGDSPDGDGAYAYVNSIRITGDGVSPMTVSNC